jgi:hypothetical protein
MAVNDDFDLGGTEEFVLPAPKKGKGKTVVVNAPIAAASEPVEAELIELDPEEDRANWPTIRIDSEDGKPNYEFVAAHGTLKNGESFGHELQLMRGVDVQVPPSIVYALRDMIATHHVPVRDASGRVSLHRQDRSAIPWQLVKGGKYIK